MERLTQELRTFIIDNFLFGDASGRFSFSNDDSFQQRGIVDSTGILELVCHVQERYGIEIDDAEIVPDNLDSVNRLAAFVGRKLSCATNPLGVIERHRDVAHAG